MLQKARELPADEIFLDLEDSVAPQLKNEETRKSVIEALRSERWVAPTRSVRINPVGSPWCLDDLLAVVGNAGRFLDCVIVPKVESSSHISFVAEVLRDLESKQAVERPIGIEAQIESPRGLLQVEAIAAESKRVEALIFGPGDYAAAAGLPQLSVGAIEPGYSGDPWHYVLSRIVTVARAYDLHAVDGPYAAFGDLDGFREVARRSRLLGFDGKWAVHPAQIIVCNEIYAPTRDEFNRALRVLSAYEESTESHNLGASTFDGEMIDEASRKMALSVVARGRAAGMVT